MSGAKTVLKKYTLTSDVGRSQKVVKRFVVIARLDIIEIQERSELFTRHSVQS